MNLYIIFESTHQTMKASSLLENDFNITLLPSPRILTESCGIAIYLSDERIERIKELLIEVPYKIYHEDSSNRFKEI